MGEFINFLGNNLADFWTYTGFANATVGHIVMILIGLFFIYLAVAKEFEPMLLIPIGFGIWFLTGPAVPWAYPHRQKISWPFRLF